MSTVQPNLTRECVLELLKLSSNVNECKPLGGGGVLLRLMAAVAAVVAREVASGRGLHSLTLQLNLSTSRTQS